jgi:hypothetical protein
VEWERNGKVVVKYALPTSDAEWLTKAEKRRYREEGFPLEFGHTPEGRIGGRCEAGFVLTGRYEDADRPGEKRPLAGLTPLFIVTRAVKR